MIDIAITLPYSWNWILPIVFGLGTGLPIMIIAWLISYSAVSISTLTAKLHTIEKWVRYISAILFIGFGIYLCAHIFVHGNQCECEHHHHTMHITLNTKH